MAQGLPFFQTRAQLPFHFQGAVQVIKRPVELAQVLVTVAEVAKRLGFRFPEAVARLSVELKQSLEFRQGTLGALLEVKLPRPLGESVGCLRLSTQRDREGKDDE